MVQQPQNRYGQRRKHFETHDRSGRKRDRAWVGAYLHGPKGVKKACRMLHWAGLNFPHWDPKPQLSISMYSGFRKHILNTFAAQIGEDVDKKERDARKAAFGKALQAVHRPIIRQLMANKTQQRAQQAPAKPPEPTQPQPTAGEVHSDAAAEGNETAVCEQLQKLGKDVQQQIQRVMVQLAEQSDRFSRLEQDVARCRKRRVQPALA